MTTSESPRVPYVEVLTDERGSILAAALLTGEIAAYSGEEIPPQGSLIPSEGQVVHKLSIPAGSEGDDLFRSINQWVVQVDSFGTAAFVPRTGA